VTETTALTTTQPKSVLINMADKYGMEPAAFEATVRATVCKSASREEFAAFLLVAKEYNLNPLTKEIFAFPAKGGGIVPVVSIDGWCRISNDHPAMDGMEFEDILEDGELIAITCRIYRKDRSRAGSVTEYMSECRGTSDVWKRWPARMLRHKAMIQAARYTFGFSGVYDEDEYERMQMARDVTPERSGMIQRLEGHQSESGFSDAAIAEIEEHAPPEKPKRGRPRKDAQEGGSEPEAIQEPETPSEAASEPQEEPEVVRPTETETAPSAEPEPASSASVTDASITSPEDSHGSEDTENSTADGPVETEASEDAEYTVLDVIKEGYPEPGEVYHLTGDFWGEDGRRDTYKDGLPFSSAKQETGHAIYEDHAPEGPGVVIEPTKAAPPPLPPELAAYVDKIEAAPTWPDIMGHIKGLSEDMQHRIRANTWDVVIELKETPDYTKDASAFRLWIETVEEPTVIGDVFSKVQAGEQFRKFPTNAQETLKLIVKRRLANIGEE